MCFWTNKRFLLPRGVIRSSLLYLCSVCPGGGGVFVGFLFSFHPPYDAVIGLKVGIAHPAHLCPETQTNLA